MKLSTLAVIAIAKVPVLPKLLIRLWAESYLRRPRHEHRFFKALKSRLDYRLRKRARLTTGQLIDIDPFDFVGRDIWHAGCYEPETIAVLQAVLSPGMVVVDAGAHVGQHSLVASQLVTASGQVHSFEPDPKTFQQLLSNMRLNSVTNVEGNQMVLSKETGTATLHLSWESNIGCSSLRQTADSSGRQIQVPSSTLDHYVELRKLRALDMIKIDVEGAELWVVQGGSKVIQRFRPAMIIEFSVNYEGFGYSQDEMRQQLKNWGYELFTVGAQPLAPYQDSSDLSYNVLALPRERLTAAIQKGLVRS